MSTELYLIRHGQAGTRDDYDRLSETGRTQATLLGESLAAQGIHFHAAVRGGLERQRQTADAVREAYGADFPAPQLDPQWNEFDLDAVYRDIAPVLARRDPLFREEYDRLLADSADGTHGIHRRWSRCDLEVARAWVTGAVACTTETWPQFEERIAGALDSLARRGIEGNVAVFTSATPVGICCSRALGVEDPRLRFRLAGALYNAAYAVLRVEAGAVGLVSFNCAEHLRGEMRTVR